MNSYYKITLSIIIAFGCLFFADKIMSKGNRSFYSHNYQKLENIFDSNTHFDILFIGSSKMHTAINPKIVDSITGLSSFNAGMDGSGIQEFKMIFEAYLLKHPPPKKIILSLDGDSFDEVYKFINYNFYLHFLGNEILDTTLTNNGFPILRYKILPFLRLIEMDDLRKRNSIAGFWGEDELRGEYHYKGYLSNGNNCIYPGLEKRYVPQGYKMEQKSISMLNSMIQECKEKNIELILTYLPEYNHKPKKIITTFDKFIAIADSISINNNLVFRRDDSLGICYEKCFFANYGHLNAAGAQQYSILIGKKLAGP